MCGCRGQQGGQVQTGHAAQVLDGMEPVVPEHLFLGHVRASHCIDRVSCTFDKPVCRLAPGGGTNDLRLCAVDPATSITSQESLVAVVAEMLGERASISAKFY